MLRLDPDIIYLNHAAVAPWPEATARAVTRFAEENATPGARHYPRWLQTERSLRELLARLINAPGADDIALLKSTSEALSLVAYGLEWQAGDNIVSFADEFPSNRIVWQSLSQFGVELRTVEASASDDPEAALMACCDQQTRLVTTSSVQYASGMRMNLERLGEFCWQNDILFCVDAIQSLGAIPFDAQQIHADFVMADGHKWMLGPEGVALFYCRPELRESLRLQQYGWHMVEDAGNYDTTDWKPSPTATRFECGSPNMLGIHALEASLSLLLDTGIDEIARNVLHNSRIIIEQASEHGLELLTPTSEERRAGIVTFRVPGTNHQKLYHNLMQQGVICAHRGGGIRFSPHFYNTEQEIKKAFSSVLKQAK